MEQGNRFGLRRLFRIFIQLALAMVGLFGFAIHRAVKARRAREPDVLAQGCFLGGGAAKLVANYDVRLAMMVVIDFDDPFS